MNTGGANVGPNPTLIGGGREEDTAVLTDAEARDWGGWERVEYLVGVLAREPGVTYKQPLPARYGSGAGGGRAAERSSGNEMMSITNII